MTRSLSRRNVLLATGATVGIAGCLGRADREVASGAPGDLTDLEDPKRRFPAVERGALLDGFETLDPWGPSIGRFRADPDDWVLGSQSMQLRRSDGGDVVRAIRAFEPPLDLEGYHLSMAVKATTAGPARVTASLYAPDRENRLRASRYLVDGLDGWIRIDLGFTDRRGDPDLSTVHELHLGARSADGDSIELRVDDLRATPIAAQPTAVLVFDNVLSTHHDVVFPLLENRGIQGVVPVGREVIGRTGRLDITQLRALRDAGWDVASRPFVDTPLPGHSADEQRATIESNQRYLAGRGFPEGSMHFFPHGYGMDATTVAIVRELHDSATTYGASPNANPPVSRFVASRFDGDAGASTRRLVDLASEYNQSVVLGFSRISADVDGSVEQFESLLDRLSDRSYEFATLTEYFDR